MLLSGSPNFSMTTIVELNLAQPRESIKYSFFNNILDLDYLVHFYLSCGDLNIKGRNCLVICDRGVMDASAFITRDQWMTILERINFEEDEIRDNRYNQGNLLRGIDNKTV